MSDYVKLVTAVQQGNSAAFGQLVVQFQDMAYFTAYQFLGQQQQAQDATQEAFWEAYRCLPNLREPQAFPAWLRRIVLKQCDRLTRGQHAALLALGDAPDLASDFTGPEAMLEQMQRRQAVLAAVNNLPEIYRGVTRLFYLDGRSYHEIANELDLPFSTVKKRLYDARQQLKENMSPMKTQAYRPSQDDKFSNRINFFIALKGGDLLPVRQLLRRDPDLLTTQTEWGVASDGWHWPLGITALHWAASTGNQPLAALLLEAGADINELDRGGSTPLHQAVHMGQTALVQWLLENGADAQIVTPHQQTALHKAVIRNRPEIVKLLLDYGSNPASQDSQGRTPLDWAQLKGLTAVVDLLDGSKSESATVVQPTQTKQIWETGIKIIDLIAPFKWGGRNGIFTPLSGIGIDVLVGELMQRMATVYQGRTVQLVLERGEFTAQSRMWQWRNCGVEAYVELVVGALTDSAARQQHLATQAVKQVQALATNQPVLFIIDTGIVPVEGVMSIFSGLDELANVTVLYDGIESIGAEPQVLADLDTAVTFDRLRAGEGWWPAIDMLRSYSHHYEDEAHRALAETAVRLARRYADLHLIYHNQGMAGFDMAYYGEAERQAVIRGRRLHCFLSQPLTVAEPWSGTPAAYVPLPETMSTVQAILNGELDEVPEEELMMIGQWSPVWT
ncbi:MAG: sigma-70 family RNA polymerase sigma factor [Anaerolineaceae bacterium]|nr:sigma-70 family RNA polymerase sigma factor [Anaerolineaceae bacterium]